MLNKMLIDLHIHSTYSDGDLTPAQLYDLAERENIKVVSLTDHDTIDGLEIAAEIFKGKHITFIPGIEMNAKVSKGQMHILGYFVDYNSKELISKLNWLVEGRRKRNAEFIKTFNNLGFDITYEDLLHITNNPVIGKPHFAKVMVMKGYASTTAEVFDNYFNKLPFTQIMEYHYTPREVIEIILQAKGIPVLAHPQSLKLDNFELEAKIAELKSLGLAGIECYHSNQTKEQMEFFKILADKYHLLITKGSDYHGPKTKPNIILGTGIMQNIVLPGETEDDIAKRLIQANTFSIQ